MKYFAAYCATLPKPCSDAVHPSDVIPRCRSASRIVTATPKPVASVRPLEPPPPSGLPVITPGVYWPTSLEYWSIIQPIICAVVPTSGAGTSSRGPMLRHI